MDFFSLSDKNGNTNGSNTDGTDLITITPLQPVKAWENFKLDTKKLIAVYNDNIKKLCNV